MTRMTRLCLSALAASFFVTACEEVPTTPDTEPPTASITAPAANTTHTDSILISVNARDNVGVTKVEVYFVGRALPVGLDSTAPYQFAVPLVTVTPGPQQFFAVAYDEADNEGVTDTIPFTSARTTGLRFVGRLEITGTVVDVAASGNVAVVAAGDGGLVAVDISNVFVPGYVARFRTSDYFNGVAINALTIYGAASTSGIIGLTLSAQDTLLEFARVSPQGINAKQIFIRGLALFAAGGQGGLYQIDASQGDTLIEGGKYDASGDVRDVEVTGNYAFTAEGNEGMRVVNVTRADSMFAEYQYAPAIQAGDIHLEGALAFVADGNGGVHSFNIGDPAAPVYLDNYNAGRSYTGVSGANGYLYLAAGDAGVEVVDARAPGNMVAVTGGLFNTIGFAHKVTAHQGFVLVADNEFLTILYYVLP